MLDIPVQPEETPVPPRYGWLKRISLAAGVYLLAVLALRLWWGYEADRRLQANIHAARAAGEAVLPEDFDSPEVPPERNAGLLYTEAADAVTLSRDEYFLMQKALGGVERLQGLDPAYLATLQTTVRNHQPSFDLLREARRRPEVSWGIRVRSPVAGAFWMWPNNHTYLNSLLMVSAAMEDLDGRPTEGLRRLSDVIAHVEATTRHPSFTAQEFGIRDIHYVCLTIESILGRIRSAPPGTGQATDHDLRVEMEALIRQLLDDEESSRRMAHAIHAQRAEHLDLRHLIQHHRTGIMSLSIGGRTPRSPMEGLIVRTLRPAWSVDASESFKRFEHFTAAAMAESFPAAKSHLEPLKAEEEPKSRILYPLGNGGFSFEFIILRQFDVRAYRRMAATALAIQLFRWDHGHDPLSLDLLVPDYLPELPADPYAADGRSFGIVWHDESPRLYSIGPNGVDDGGRFQIRKPRGRDEDGYDLPFFLDGQRPSRLLVPPQND